MMGAGTCTFSPIPGGGWLNLCAGEQRILVVKPGDDEGLTAYLSPQIDARQVPTDQWVLATGHLDDPDAETCDREGPDGAANDPEQVVSCRLAFVLERVDPAP